MSLIKPLSRVKKKREEEEEDHKRRVKVSPYTSCRVLFIHQAALSIVVYVQK